MSNDGKEMPLLGHIGELRKHLIRIVIVVLVFAIAIFSNIEWFTDNVLLAPSKNDFISIVKVNEFFKSIDMPGTQFKYSHQFQIQQREVEEAFNLSIKIAVIGGIVLGFPYIVWELWRFVAPGLKPHEKKNARWYILFTILLFFIGASFGYYIIAPISLQFFVSYSLSSLIDQLFSITSVLNLILTCVLGMAIMFLFPVISFVLSKLGILTPQMLKKYRKHAFIVILVIGALITPSDIMSMFVAAIPLLLLFEMSVLISKSVYKNENTVDLS